MVLLIRFTCACGKRLKAPVEQAGHRGRCTKCGATFAVPFASASSSAPEPALPAAAAEEPPLLAPQFDSRRDVLAEAQVVPDVSRCVQCGICSHNCPMGIDVRGHARRGRPIHDSRCLTCSECVNRCPRGVLQFERLILLGIDT